MSLKTSLGNRPVLYEIVPPRRDTSRFHTELRGVDEVLHDARITAINVPELMSRRKERGRVHYSPTTIPPEEYALMIKEYKESVVNIIAPRLRKGELLDRTTRILHEYGIPNLVLVGKEKHEDILPGPSVVEALKLVGAKRGDQSAIGGICIFDRESPSADEYRSDGTPLTEARRIWLKAEAGCDFVTSQITFNSQSALDFLFSYQELCDRADRAPLTVFISLTTIPSMSILSLIEGLDVVVPPSVRKRLLDGSSIGSASLKLAAEVFREIVVRAEQRKIRIPLGLQVEQIGINNDSLSLELLDSVYPIIH